MSQATRATAPRLTHLSPADFTFTKNHLEGASGVPKVAEKRDAASRTLHRFLVHAVKCLPPVSYMPWLVVIKARWRAVGREAKEDR